MKRALLTAALLFSCSVAFAGPANILLDPNKVRSMSAEEYAEAVRSAPDVNARDDSGYTPMHIAAIVGTPANIAALVSAGADVNARSKVGAIPLHLAAGYGTPDHIAALVNAGADINARNMVGRTPLHNAARYGTPDNIAALLEADASGSVKDVDGKTPFDLAEDNDRVKGTAAYWALNDAQYK